MAEEGIVGFWYYPCLKRKAGRKRRKCHEALIFAYYALVFLKFFLHYIAEDAPLPVTEVLLCADQFLVDALRHNRQGDKLRVFMLERCACRLAVIFKYEEVFEPFILDQVKRTAAEYPQHLFHLGVC